MAYLTPFFAKNSRKKSQRSGRGSSRLGQIPNFYRKFVSGASLSMYLNFNILMVFLANWGSVGIERMIQNGRKDK